MAGGEKPLSVRSVRSVEADVLVVVPERRNDGVPGGGLLGEAKHLAAGVGVVEEVQDETARLVQRDGVQVAEGPVVRDDGRAARVRAARRAEPGVRGEQLAQRVELVVIDQEGVPGEQFGDLRPGLQAGDPPFQGLLRHVAPWLRRRADAALDGGGILMRYSWQR